MLEACWKYFVLGIVQGITEFLPISSTAHLKIVPVLLGWGDPGISITAVLQLGSVLAVIIYFKNDLKYALQGIYSAITRNQWKTRNGKLGITIIIGTIPIIIVGALIKLFWIDFQSSALRSIPFIGLLSIIMAALLGIAEYLGSQDKNISIISRKDGLLIGISQIFAIIPGVSRSGVTLTTAMFLGWERKDAARFSFLLGIPAISFSGLAEFSNALHNGFNPNYGFLPLVVGLSTSVIVSWLSIDWLLNFLQKNNTFIFILYRFIFGIALLLI